MALDGRTQHDARRVDAVLEAGGADEAHAERLALVLILGVDATEQAAVALVDLVAVLRIVEEKGEVVEQVERVIAAVAADRDRLGLVEAPGPVHVEVEALRLAALVRIDGAES